jgi:hypothetical protein
MRSLQMAIYGKFMQFFNARESYKRDSRALRVPSMVNKFLQISKLQKSLKITSALKNSKAPFLCFTRFLRSPTQFSYLRKHLHKPIASIHHEAFITIMNEE